MNTLPKTFYDFKAQIEAISQSKVESLPLYQGPQEQDWTLDMGNEEDWQGKLDYMTGKYEAINLEFDNLESIVGALQE